MPSPIFRAEPLTESLRDGKPQFPRTTVRFPSNVPYIVDNLWEFLRPKDMPSRRQVIYASPTRELAQANCSGIDKGLGLCVYEVLIDGRSRMAQLKVADARDHPDVKAIKKLVQDKIPRVVTATPVARQCAAMLFLPGGTAADWESVRQSCPPVTEFIAEAVALSTFWASSTSQHNGTNGELFVELSPGASFAAKDLHIY